MVGQASLLYRLFCRKIEYSHFECLYAPSVHYAIHRVKGQLSKQDDTVSPMGPLGIYGTALPASSTENILQEFQKLARTNFHASPRYIQRNGGLYSTQV